MSLTQALVNLSQTGIGKRDTAEIQRKIFEGLTNWFSQAIQNLSWQITTGLRELFIHLFIFYIFI